MVTTETNSNPADVLAGSFADLFENSEVKVASVGEVVSGTVIGIMKDRAIIDIGDKSESSVSLSEFKIDGEGVGAIRAIQGGHAHHARRLPGSASAAQSEFMENIFCG